MHARCAGTALTLCTERGEKALNKITKPELRFSFKKKQSDVFMHELFHDQRCPECSCAQLK